MVRQELTKEKKSSYSPIKHTQRITRRKAQQLQKPLKVQSVPVASQGPSEKIELPRQVMLTPEKKKLTSKISTVANKRLLMLTSTNPEKSTELAICTQLKCESESNSPFYGRFKSGMKTTALQMKNEASFNKEKFDLIFEVNYNDPFLYVSNQEGSNDDIWGPSQLFRELKYESNDIDDSSLIAQEELQKSESIFLKNTKFARDFVQNDDNSDDSFDSDDSDDLKDYQKIFPKLDQVETFPTSYSISAAKSNSN